MLTTGLDSKVTKEGDQLGVSCSIQMKIVVVWPKMVIVELVVFKFWICLDDRTDRVC